MDKLVEGYIEYLNSLKQIARPKMPNFDLTAYTDSEFNIAIDEIMQSFNEVDDFALTIKFLTNKN